LMTFFYMEMRQLIENDHLYIALPPLYRITQGGRSLYARDDAHKDELLKSAFDGKGKIEISRFKGLGEMPSSQLRETTMDPASRTLLRVTVPESDKAETAEEAKDTDKLVDSLMGRKPELRLAYIQEHAPFLST
ncbi:MAG: DNA topoisomerase IV subunit B, partial [Rhodospirillales bacterium]